MNVELQKVLDAIEAVRQRHSPPSSPTGSIYSEAVQVCNEIGRAVLALPAVPEGGKS